MPYSSTVHGERFSFADLPELILTPQFPALWQATLAGGFLPEVAAAVAKIMSDLDLVLAARPLRTVTRCRNTMGEPGTLGGRLQPDHPTDDLAGILASVVDGLGYACGDAVIGVNPATDSAARTAHLLAGLNEFAALEIPTQTCVLAHVSTQIAALELGAPVDLLFQSLAGTEEANRSFGVCLSLLQEARAAVLEGAARARAEGTPGAAVQLIVADRAFRPRRRQLRAAVRRGVRAAGGGTRLEPGAADRGPARPRRPDERGRRAAGAAGGDDGDRRAPGPGRAGQHVGVLRLPADVLLHRRGPQPDLQHPRRRHRAGPGRRRRGRPDRADPRHRGSGVAGLLAAHDGRRLPGR